MYEDYIQAYKVLIRESVQNLGKVEQHIDNNVLEFAPGSQGKVNNLIQELKEFSLEKSDEEQVIVLGKKIKVLIDDLKAAIKLPEVRPMVDDSLYLYEESQTSERTKKFQRRSQQLKFNHLIEPIEVQLEKVAFHYRRKEGKILDILQEIRERVEFFNIFNISEKIQMEKIDIAQNRKMLKRYEEKFEEYDQLIGELLEK